MSKKLTVNKINIHFRKVIKTETTLVKENSNFYLTGGDFKAGMIFVNVKDINQISLGQWIHLYFEKKRNFVTK